MKASFDKGFVEKMQHQGRTAVIAKIEGVCTMQYGIPKEHRGGFAKFLMLLHFGKEPQAAFDEAFPPAQETEERQP